jgi:NAD-dependent dihydropyrimidine dehydrogenase PreA subunit
LQKSVVKMEIPAKMSADLSRRSFLERLALATAFASGGSGCHAPPHPSAAYVIAEPCIGTKDVACVDVCPVDCIHPRKDEAGFKKVPQLYINPVECIGCGECVLVCPVSAILPSDRLPKEWEKFVQINARYYLDQK